jgi:3-dehydroquinate synthase
MNINKTLRFTKKSKKTTLVHITKNILDGVEHVCQTLDNNTQHFFITDNTVDRLFGSIVMEHVFKNKICASKLVVPDGELSKSSSVYFDLASQIVSKGVTRDSSIISLGGGVVNNIAGLLAATIYRGLNLVHIPTTFMAQVDAALDVRQAINIMEGKNLLGAMYSPSTIIICTDFLKTLNDRELVNGVAEAIKHALFQDKDFFTYLTDVRLSSDKTNIYEQILHKGIALKVSMLNYKLKDSMDEMGPQYGHLFGHAIESISNYSLLHGEAISIGMCLSAEVAQILGIASPSVTLAHYDIMLKFRLPVFIPLEMKIETILDKLTLDKFWSTQGARMGLIDSIGNLYKSCNTTIQNVPVEILRQAIQENIAKSHSQNYVEENLAC